MLPRLSLVLGGAASGKSVFAEGLVLRSGRAPVYLATAEAFDDEMRAKLVRHRARRAAMWRTIEAPRDPAPALAAMTASEAVLMDCATMWLSNHLLAESNLVVPDNVLARRFQTAQGALNQRLAAKAGLVVNVIAGLPMVLKGTLP
jgi:adenosylcobinamide kinase/adenosylcobinamide-phosphate guanylyltransferase